MPSGKTRSLFQIFLAAALLAANLAGCPKPQPKPIKYSIILLDPREAEAHALNEKSEVVGDLTFDKSEAFLWQPDRTPKLMPLGSLGGSKSSAADINAYTEVCGLSKLFTQSFTHGFRWTENDGMQDIGLEGWDGAAFGINDKGEIVGRSNGPDGVRASIWTEADGLTFVSGAPNISSGEGINGFSNIAGNQYPTAGSPAPDEGRVWRGESAPYIIKNTLGGENAHVHALNDLAAVVGWAEDEEYRRVAMKWTKAGGMSKLDDFGGHLFFSGMPGPFVADASSINFHGDIVGKAVIGSELHAVLWKDGTLYDLNDLVPQNTDWTVLEEATDINNKGCIVGNGQRKEAGFYAFLLAPVVVYELNLSDSVVVGGNIVQVTAVLDGDAPFALEIEAELTGELSRVADLVSNMATVREGARTTEFVIETQPVESRRSGEVRVSFGGNVLTARLYVDPA